MTYFASRKDKLCGRMYEAAFTDLEQDAVVKLYAGLYANCAIDYAPRLHIRCADVEIHITNVSYGSLSSRNHTLCML